jgi:23S rRNA pseudouridine2457 synthase
LKHQYYLLYKPYNVLSQFTTEAADQVTLADILKVDKDVYPVGRLDYDSEGLLLLSNDKKLNVNLLGAESKKEKTYYVQVDGDITQQAVSQLINGVTIKLPSKALYKTLPCRAKKILEPQLPERKPPIRFRAEIPTSWISITINEGKNRQIRKMCAAVGYPVLRLVRFSFGDWNIRGMASGELKKIDV